MRDLQGLRQSARKIFPLWLLLSLGLAVPAWSQVQNASLTGLVTDPSGAVVPGVTIIVTSKATNIQQQATTGETATTSSPPCRSARSQSVRKKRDSRKPFTTKLCWKSASEDVTISACKSDK